MTFEIEGVAEEPLEVLALFRELSATVQRGLGEVKIVRDVGRRALGETERGSDPVRVSSSKRFAQRLTVRA